MSEDSEGSRQLAPQASSCFLSSGLRFLAFSTAQRIVQSQSLALVEVQNIVRVSERELDHIAVKQAIEGLTLMNKLPSNSSIRQARQNP